MNSENQFSIKDNQKINLNIALNSWTEIVAPLAHLFFEKEEEKRRKTCVIPLFCCILCLLTNCMEILGLFKYTLPIFYNKNAGLI
jgi:hypothetical protein